VISYRLDRLAVLPLIGLHVIGAGIATLLAFFVWGPLGVLVVLLLLHAARLAFLPPSVVRTDPEGVRLGGQFSVKPVRLAWSDVEDVSVDRRTLQFDRADGGSVSFPLVYVGAQRDALAKDVYERLNAVNGYRRFDPSID
jgi:hypothetical protein